MSTKDKLFTKIADAPETNGHKVSVVGTGCAGMAVVFSILTQKISKDVCLVDQDPEKLLGELMDLQHGALFLGNPKLQCSNDYAVSAGSKVVVITAGARQGPDESRLDLVHKNVEIMKGVVPQIVKYSPDAIILVVSNPCDVLAYVVWKLSGLPKNRVIGTGTNLDSSRFRFLISEKLGVAPSSVHGFIIGEHGDSSVAVWSSVSVGGVNLSDLNADIGTGSDSECWFDVHQKVVKAAYEVIKRKGYTSWAIGLSTAQLVESILTNSNKIHAVASYVKGVHGIEDEIFISLPAIVNFNGVSHIVQQKLTESERCQLKFSVSTVAGIQAGIKL